MDLGQARGEYLDYLAIERGSSDNTVAAYGRDLSRYVAWLGERGVSEPDDVTRPLVEEHVAALGKFGPTPIHRKTFEPVKSLLRKGGAKVREPHSDDN